LSKSPPPGETPPQAAEGVHFHARKGGWPVFHRAKPGCKGFIQTGAFNELKAASPPLNLLHLLNPHAQKGVSKVPHFLTSDSSLLKIVPHYLNVSPLKIRKYQKTH